MRDLTFTDSVHHTERSARGAIPYWSLAKIHIPKGLILMQLHGLQGCVDQGKKVPWTGSPADVWALRSGTDIICRIGL